MERDTLQRYRDFAPTGFDAKGAFLDDDRQDWLVVPVSRNRDSQPFDESNFAAALEILGGESDTVEVHRFGHWGPGWFEIIIVSPEREPDVQAIADKLENYPVLDEEDLSARESEDANESWDNWARGDFRRTVERRFETLFPDVDVPDFSDETLDAWAEDTGAREYETHDDGPYFPNPAELVHSLESSDFLPFVRWTIEECENWHREHSPESTLPVAALHFRGV